MEAQSNQERPEQSCQKINAKTTERQIPAMSAQQIISNSGQVNMLEGRTIRLNLFVPKKP